MASPASDTSDQLRRPALGSASRSSSFHATSLAVSAARRFTLPPHAVPAPGSAVSLSGTISPRSIPAHAHTHRAAAPAAVANYATFGLPDDVATSAHAPALAIPGNGNTNAGAGAGTGTGKAKPPIEHASSVHFPGTVNPHPPAGSPALSPGGRRRSSAAPKYRWLSGGGRTGDEPGVDVRSQRDEDSYGHLKAETKVTVVDYSSDPTAEDTNVRVEFKGSRLRAWLDGEHGRRAVDADGKPAGVRWIHVEGINWEVIKTLTLEYGLHPLAVEDALRSSGSPRSKLDFYRTHLYMQILVQHMNASDGALLEEAADELDEHHAGVVSRDGFTHDGSGTGAGAGSAVDGATGGGGAGQGPYGAANDVDVELGTRKRKEGLWGSWRRKTGLMRLPEGVEGVFEPSVQGTRLQGGQSPFNKQAHRMVVDQLSAKYMVPIRRSIMSVFMTRDGTLISLTAQKQCQEVLEHIYARLEDEHSLLRRSGDVGMLTQALLDVGESPTTPISQAFEAGILQLESSVLVDPQVEIVRHLHILSSQLIRLRRSLSPLLHVCYVMRDQEVQRAMAASTLMTRSEKLAKMSQSSVNLASDADPSAEHEHQHRGRPDRDVHGMPPGPHRSASSLAAPSPRPAIGLSGLPGLTLSGLGDEREREPALAASTGATPTPLAGGAGTGSQQAPSPTGAAAAGTGAGFFSPLTKVYIGDVIDHLEQIVGSMDQFVATCDHLTDYVFNTLAFRSNASMERLSIVTVVFLPLTFIASYFGMNFTDFPDLEQSVNYFWKIAAPCTVGFFVIFSWAYIRVGAETAVRRAERWRRTRRLGIGKVRQKRE
ncbi:hypothetical protein Q5752_005393 [Cryptotrichosporon argae]